MTDNSKLSDAAAKISKVVLISLAPRPDSIICKETGNRNSNRELYASESGRISSCTSSDPSHLKLSEKIYAEI